jgi:hypothetical protein
MQISAQSYIKANVKASLDWVIFDNGEFAGPDLDHGFERMLLEEEARWSVVRALRDMSASSDSEILAFLEDIIRAQPSASYAPLLHDYVTLARSRTAMDMRSQLRSKGRVQFNSFLTSLVPRATLWRK